MSKICQSQEKIIRQAESVMIEVTRIGEIISEEKGQIGGKFALSVGPTIAQYILPRFIKNYRESFPSVELSIHLTLTMGHPNHGMTNSGLINS